MASITLDGNPASTVGELPAEGTPAPAFSLIGANLGPITSADFAGQRLVLNIFPSIETGVCSTSVRRFNEVAAGLDNTTVLCVSADLPFTSAKFCGAEGLDRVTTASTFRSPEFGTDYGVTILDGAFGGLLARSVVVVDTDGSVLHSQLVAEIADEPDYDAAIAALG